MKIAFVIQDLFAQGAQHVTALMVKGFIKRGYDVDLIVSQVHRDLVEAGRADAFEVPKATNWIYLRDRKARNNIAELRRYLKTTDAKAVIAMSPNYTQALRLAAIGQDLKCKLIHVEHGLACCNDAGEITPPRKKWSISSLFYKWFWSKFDKVFVVSSAAVQDFLNVYPWYSKNRIHVVHNPVVDDEFFTKMNAGPQHPWLKNKTMKTFVTAGAFVENKGHMTILRAMKIAVEQGIKARIIIFGRGRLENTYKTYIKENHLGDYISIPGFTNNFAAEAHAADGYLLSSVTESFGLALVEGLACGCPAIATDAPYGPREILKGGKFGALVPVGNADAYSEELLKLAATPKSYADDEAWAPYTIDAAVDKYEAGIGKPVYLYITPFFPSEKRWQGGFCYDAVQALKQVGNYDVRVIRTGESTEDYEYNGVKVYGIKRFKAPLDAMPFLFARINGFMLKRKLKKIGVDVRDVAVCHANMEPEYAYSIKKANPAAKALWQTHWMGAPFTLSVYRLGSVKGLTDLLYLYWRKMLEAMDSVVLLSKLHEKQFGKAYPNGPLGEAIDMREQTLFKHYRSITPKKTIVFYNGINTQVFNRGGDGVNSEKNGFTIGCVGNFGPTKGQMTLLKAIKRVVERKTIEGLKVKLVGSGPKLEDCRRFVESNKLSGVVEFIKECDHLKLPKMYRSFDLFVLPTWQEGFCCVLVEAVGCGVPAMATKAVSFAEVIPESEHDKWLITPQDDAELANRIERYYNNRDEFEFNRSMDINDLWKEFIHEI